MARVLKKARLAGFFSFSAMALIFIVLALIYMVSPWLLNEFGHTGHNDQRAAEYVSLMGCLFLLFLKSAQRSVLQQLEALGVGWLLALVCILIWCGLSSYGAASPLRSYQEVGLYGVLLLGAFCVSPSIPKCISVIQFVVLLVAGLLVLKLLAQYFAGLAYPQDLVNRPYIYGFSNPRSVNHLQAFLLPVLVYLSWTNSCIWRGLGIYAITILLWCLLFYTQGRGVALAIAIAVFPVLVVMRQSKDRITVGLEFILPCVLGFCVYWLLYVIIPEYALGVGGRNYLDRISDSDGGRVSLWAESFRHISRAPFLGYGGQSFPSLLSLEPKFGSAHNMPLNIWLEFGMAPFLFFIVCSCYGYWRYCVNLFYSKKLELSTFWMPLPLWVILVYSGVTGVLLSPGGQLCFVLALAMFLSTLTPIRGDYAYRPLIIILSKVALILLLTYGWISVSYTGYDLIFNREGIANCGEIDLVETRCMPRLWVNGAYWAY